MLHKLINLKDLKKKKNMWNTNKKSVEGLEKAIEIQKWLIAYNH